MFPIKKHLLLAVLLLPLLSLSVFGQEDPEKNSEKKAEAPPVAKIDPKNLTGEQIAETVIFIYGLPSGRAVLNQIRKTTYERGQATYTGADGQVQRANYRRYIIRAEKLDDEKIRLDQEFPNARYSLVFSGDKIYGIFNNTVFTPREDAAKSFENQIVRGIEALLRYKENESTLEMAQREKIMGVDYYVLDVTDTKNRKTRFFISVKSFRVMMITYEDEGVNYRRRFYDYNLAQGTLVPFRTVLWANDKQVEETQIGTVTFGQKVDDGLFTIG